MSARGSERPLPIRQKNANVSRAQCRASVQPAHVPGAGGVGGGLQAWSPWPARGSGRVDWPGSGQATQAGRCHSEVVVAL